MQDKIATFFKKHSELKFWDSRNTQTSSYCKGLKQAKMTLQMIEATKGIKQTLVVER